ncbi:helix-turn-helix domain-containing protein [Enterococcus hirae]|uniref:helix-turn-helix domain-containing protein n=1 Tax=Enterococcus hirae TaxID=1354 RepID=UPI0038464ABD
MSNFALRLKELRTQKKISQEQLARYLGMKRENISNYERGIVTNVNSETLDKLANYFNVSVDYLLGRTENPNPVGNGHELEWNDVIFKDSEEEDLLAAFRLESEDMTEEEKKKFNNSLKGMMKIAKGLLNDDSKWNK